MYKNSVSSLTFDIADFSIHPKRHQVVYPQDLFVREPVIGTFHFTYLWKGDAGFRQSIQSLSFNIYDII